MNADRDGGGSAAGPLAGLTVVDFSTLLPGPLATLLLTEAGAEVIKIENPAAGDPMRAYAPGWDGAGGAAFALLNRGKKSVALDLKNPSERERLEPLLRRADVLVEQFRPGVMERLGLGRDALRTLNPALVYCAISGYGQSGPRRDIAGHDLNYVGLAGLLALGDPSRPLPALVADIAGGAYPAVINILLALYRRERGGGGAFVDIAMADNVFPFLFWAQAAGQSGAGWPGGGDALLSGGSPRYRLYPTADGEPLAVAALEQKFWQRFCRTIALDAALADDARDPAATAARVAELIAARPAAYWRETLLPADCCCCLVQSAEQAFADPAFRARGLFERVVGRAGDDAAPATLNALPTPLAAALRGAGTAAHAPLLGADNAACLG